MKTLALDFEFSQSNLQDYVTCQRRFNLKYIKHLSWPAIESDPIHKIEDRMQLGSDFHRLVHQHLVGLPENLLTETVTASQFIELPSMWQDYLTFYQNTLAKLRQSPYTEITLTTILNNYRLVAKYDMIAFLDDKTLIIDWKTNVKRPLSYRLVDRLQSKVYPYMLHVAGSHLNNGNNITISNIMMMYWFTAMPDNPYVIDYNSDLHEQNEIYLSNLIEEISMNNDFPLTDDEKACRFCVYRSYCDRGDVAGMHDEMDDDVDVEDFSLDVEWEQISEIAY